MLTVGVKGTKSLNTLEMGALLTSNPNDALQLQEVGLQLHAEFLLADKSECKLTPGSPSCGSTQWLPHL